MNRQQALSQLRQLAEAEDIPPHRKELIHRIAQAFATEQQWLVEVASKSGALSWWSLTDTQGEGGYFVSDSQKALRFARREDAQAYIDDAGWTAARPMPFLAPIDLTA